MSLTVRDVAELYVAMFQRAPEGEGLSYWLATANSRGFNKAQLAQEMAKAAVQLANTSVNAALFYPHYAGINVDNMTYNQAREIVNRMYQVLFNKDATVDPQGVDFWARAIAEKRATFGKVVADMIDAAKTYLNSNDQAARNAAQAFVNKVDVAIYTAQQIQQFNGDFGMFQGFIRNVNHTEQSKTEAMAAISGTFTRFELTGAYDVLTGTSGNDVFRAAAGALNQTAIGVDTINGNDGYDTLIADVNLSRFNNQVVSPVLISVEELQLRSVQDGAVNNPNLDLNSASGVRKIVADVTSNSIGLTNLASPDIQLEIKGVNRGAGFSYRAGSTNANDDTVNITLTGYKKDANGRFDTNTITLLGQDPTGVEVVNLRSTIEDNFVNRVDVVVGNNTTLQTLNISGDKLLHIENVNFAAQRNATVNASNFEGPSLTLASINIGGISGATITGSRVADSIGLSGVTGANANVTINTGDGNDMVYPAGNATVTGNLTINTGNGNDTIWLQNNAGTITVNGRVTIDAGDGSDTINLANGNQATVVLNRNNSGFDTINNFVITNDSLRIAGLSNFEVDAAFRNYFIRDNDAQPNVNFGNTTRAVPLFWDGGIGTATDGTGMLSATVLDTINNTINTQYPGLDLQRQFPTINQVQNSAQTETINNAQQVTVGNVTYYTATINGVSVRIYDIGQNRIVITDNPQGNTNPTPLLITRGTITQAGNTATVQFSYIRAIDPDTTSANNTGTFLQIPAFADFVDGDDADVWFMNPIAGFTAYTNESAVLAALNGTAHGLTMNNVGDDNILVIRENNTRSYVYYYYDANGNGRFDTTDTLKLLAVVNADTAIDVRDITI